MTAGTRRETDWITRDMRRVFPREWQQFAVPDPDGDLSVAYARLLADPDPHVRENAALAWCVWEDTHVSLAPGWEPRLRYEDAAFRATFAPLVTHYWSHGCFLDGTPLLDGMQRLQGIPATLLHGRYDVSGPLDTAWQLHLAWPGSELVVLDDAGHGGGSFGSELVRALDGYRGAP